MLIYKHVKNDKEVKSLMIHQLNVMRALSAIGIIFIHVTSGQALVNSTAYGVNQFFRFASPMFILVSGMVLVYIEMKRPSLSLPHFYKKRFTRVLVPYVIWSLICFLYVQIHLVFESQWTSLGRLFISDFPEQLLQGSAFVHLYFILIMAQFLKSFYF